MADVSSGPGADTPAGGRVPRRAMIAAAAAGLILAVVLWGGYSHRWPWTGIDGGTATLWDWLHLLLLPVAFAVIPVWARSDTRVGAPAKRKASSVLAGFVALVILGYTVPWAWTGFSGNTVWDWLELVLLPLAVVLAPRMAELRHAWSPRHSALAVAATIAFAVIVVGGYVGGWAWTGFSGNTLWDWLHLLLLPLLLPTLVVPAMAERMTGSVVYLDADGNPVPAAADPSLAAGEAAPEVALDTAPAAPTVPTPSPATPGLPDDRG